MPLQEKEAARTHKDTAIGFTYAPIEILNATH